MPNGADITVRELLNMTRGLFDFSADQGFQQQAFLVDGTFAQTSHRPSCFVAH
jgi:hypothetical protein